MKCKLLILYYLIGSTLISCQNTKKVEPLNYPQIKSVNAIDTLHGKAVPDPYRQLEDMESDETNNWVNKQEILLDNFIKEVPGNGYVKNRLEELTQYDLFTVPTQRGDQYFYLELHSGKDRASLILQEGKDSNPQVLIDPNKTFLSSKKNIPYLGKPGFYVNNAGSKIGVLIADGPSRWYEMQVYDLKSRKFTKDRLEGFYNVSKDIVWDNSDNGFYYVRYLRNKSESDLKVIPESPSVYYHKLGDDQKDDKLIYKTTHSAEILTLSISNELKYLVVHTRKGSSRVNQVLLVDIQNSNPEIEFMFNKEDANYLYLGNRGNKYWFYTDLDAPNGRIISLNLTDISNISETIQESSAPISASSLVGGNAIGLFGETSAIYKRLLT